MGKPWTGEYVFSSGDLVEDLTHNFFLETGARNNKLKIYEMVEHPAARALTGYLLVRGGVHQVAYARALENLTGANLMKLFPSPNIPTASIPECKPHIKRGEHLKLYRWSEEDFLELAAVFNGPHPETGEELVVAEEIHPEGAPAFDLPSAAGRLRAGAGSRRDRGDRSPAARRSRTAGDPDGRRRSERDGERLNAGPGRARMRALPGRTSAAVVAEHVLVFDAPVARLHATAAACPAAQVDAAGDRVVLEIVDAVGVNRILPPDAPASTARLDEPRARTEKAHCHLQPSLFASEFERQRRRRMNARNHRAGPFELEQGEHSLDRSLRAREHERGVPARP